MNQSELIRQLSETILSWENTALGKADFGVVAFLFMGKEFGHIHPSGELDIAFGLNLTEELLKTGLVDRHQFVPKTSITLRVSGPEDFDLAINLLRLFYFLKLKPRSQKYSDFLVVYETQLKDLPPEILNALKNL